MEDNKLKEFIEGYENSTTSDIYTNIISEFGDINIFLDSRGTILQIKTPAGSIFKNLSSWANKNIYDFFNLLVRRRRRDFLSKKDPYRMRWYFFIDEIYPNI